MVYGVAEVNRGNLPPEDHQKVMETLQVFSEVVAETCEGLGLMRGSIGVAPVQWTAFSHATLVSPSLTSSCSAGLRYPKAECLLRLL